MYYCKIIVYVSCSCPCGGYDEYTKYVYSDYQLRKAIALLEENKLDFTVQHNGVDK